MFSRHQSIVYGWQARKAGLTFYNFMVHLLVPLVPLRLLNAPHYQVAELLQSTLLLPDSLLAWKKKSLAHILHFSELTQVSCVAVSTPAAVTFMPMSMS